LAFLFLIMAIAAHAQQPIAQLPSTPHPPDYPGVRVHIPGVFVTPVPGAPFSGTLTRRTINYIARNSAGVIHNERRRLQASSSEDEPTLLSSHIFDPATRLSTFLNPDTHVARQMVLPKPPEAPENSTPETAIAPENAQNLQTKDLGTQTVAGLILKGTRKERTVPAAYSGTGKDVIITDDYWYSEDLKVYLVLKHNDPRTGEQIVGIVKSERKEPDTALFQIPVGYKVVDETSVKQGQ
jgi:hypothetical protein